MPIITSIKPQKNKKRVNIYLDDKFGFGIDLENYLTLRLKVNQEFSDEEIEKLIKTAEFQKVLDKLLMFATLRPRSEKEVRDYFKRRKVHESLHNELFDRLNHLKLIDDEKFANWWVEQRQSFRPKPKRVLIQELRLKGIDKEIVIKVLGNNDIDEIKMATETLEKRLYKWKGLEPRIAKQKITQYLMGKGFSWDVIEKVLSKGVK
ncbi:MAG: RecX family transcriptional regulator [Microgenomates group bacterium]